MQDGTLRRAAPGTAPRTERRAEGARRGVTECDAEHNTGGLATPTQPSPWPSLRRRDKPPFRRLGSRAANMASARFSFAAPPGDFPRGTAFVVCGRIRVLPGRPHGNEARNSDLYVGEIMIRLGICRCLWALRGLPEVALLALQREFYGD